MKKSIFIVLFLSIACSARAQEVPAVKSVENTDEEVFEMLRLLGARGFRFDLSAFNAGEYEVIPFIEEYVNGQKVEDDGFRFSAGPNWRPMIPDDAFRRPEDREKFLEGKTLSADGQKYLAYEDMGLFLVPQNDSTTRLGFNLYGAMSRGYPRLKLRPLENSDPARYMYDCRPFAIHPAAERQQHIPLLLYGSYWWDERINGHRFCGEREFQPDLASETLKEIPHYYIIGIEVRKVD